MTLQEEIELMIRLEGLELTAYDCSAGRRTVGLGFNMDAASARNIWALKGIEADFDAVYNKQAEITKEDAVRLFEDIWRRSERQAIARTKELGLEWDSFPEWKQFILKDIAYNTGSVKNWKKVFMNKGPVSVLVEARRNPKEIMDSRVAKIGYALGIIDSLDMAKSIGLEYAKYIV